jgi:hypothetical protein
MLVVVAVNLGMALEAHRDGVFDAIVTTLFTGYDVIRLNLYAAEPVADATAPVAPRQEFGYLFPWERHPSLLMPY